MASSGPPVGPEGEAGTGVFGKGLDIIDRPLFPIDFDYFITG
jgi:hypothetical protein